MMILKIGPLKMEILSLKKKKIFLMITKKQVSDF